jgi:hypothetical protein
MSETAYDRIGCGYAKTRQADPRNIRRRMAEGTEAVSR